MSGRFQGTEVFEAPERRDPREARRRRRGPRGGTVFIWLLVLAVIGVGLAFGLRIIDQTVRGVAQDQAEKQIADQLPGQITGRVNVSIEGDWVIPQLIRGTLDRVVLDGPNLQADGTPFQAHIVATVVPTDQERTVGDVVATVSMASIPPARSSRRPRARRPTCASATGRSATPAPRGSSASRSGTPWPLSPCCGTDPRS